MTNRRQPRSFLPSALFAALALAVAVLAVPAAATAAEYAEDPKPLAGNWKGLPETWAKEGFDAILRWDGQTWYIFKGNQYLKYRPGHGVVQAPQQTSKYWLGLPEEFARQITAGVEWWGGVYYLFSRDGRYIKVTRKNDAKGQKPKPVYRNWRGVPRDFKVSAAFNSRRNWVVYLFSDDGRYVRYHKDKKGQWTKPVLGNWPNLNTRIDAVEAYSNTTYYMTSGGTYQRYLYPLPKKARRGCGHPGNKPCVRKTIVGNFPYCRKVQYIITGGRCRDPAREFTKVVKSLGKSPCGTKGQRGCFPGEKAGVVSCESGLALSASLRCMPLACGKLGQRPCRVTEMIPSCPGLTEDFVQDKCVKSLECGKDGQRPCLVVERIPSCDKGLAEDFLKNKCVPDRFAKAVCIATMKAFHAFRQAPTLRHPAIDALIEQYERLKKHATASLDFKLGLGPLETNLERHFERFRPPLVDLARIATAMQEKQRQILDLFTPQTFCGSKSQLRAKVRSLGLTPRQRADLGAPFRLIPSAHAATPESDFAGVHLAVTVDYAQFAVTLSPGIVWSLRSGSRDVAAVFAIAGAKGSKIGQFGFGGSLSLDYTPATTVDAFGGLGIDVDVTLYEKSGKGHTKKGSRNVKIFDDYMTLWTWLEYLYKGQIELNFGWDVPQDTAVPSSVGVSLLLAKEYERMQSDGGGPAGETGSVDKGSKKAKVRKLLRDAWSRISPAVVYTWKLL